MAQDDVDREIYGHLQGLLEAWTGLERMESEQTVHIHLTPAQKNRLRDLGELLSLRFVLNHADDRLLHLVADL